MNLQQGAIGCLVKPRDTRRCRSDHRLKLDVGMQCWTFRLLATLVAAYLALESAHAFTGVEPAGVAEAAPQAAHELARRVLDAGDNAGLPFVIVHKRAALVLVYHADGKLAGVSSVLLGVTPGDQSAAGVGERTRNGNLRVSDLTTPAGRFESEPGHNLSGEAIVWIDYASALAIHRLRPGVSRTQRARRIASVDVGDKRASAGCVVVPEAFYDRVIDPVLGRARGIVYVMPENSSWRTMWRGLGAALY